MQSLYMWMKVFSFSFTVPAPEVGQFIINNFNMELSHEVESKTGQRLLATIMTFTQMLTVIPSGQRLQKASLV